jgi:hypothetical protein
MICHSQLNGKIKKTMFQTTNQCVFDVFENTSRWVKALNKKTYQQHSNLAIGREGLFESQ